MESPIKTKRKGDSVGVDELIVAKIVKSAYNENDTVSIMCLIDGVVTVTGTVTGNKYTFPRAGHPVDVDVRDKDEILNKKRGRSCCGGQSGKNLFVLNEGN